MNQPRCSTWLVLATRTKATWKRAAAAFPYTRTAIGVTGVIETKSTPPPMVASVPLRPSLMPRNVDSAEVGCEVPADCSGIGVDHRRQPGTLEGAHLLRR